jgi:UDP-glucose 4-epimerase
MRVIVTGAAGFIGRNVLLRAPRDWRVFAVSRHAADLAAFAAAHGLAHVEVLECDLTQPDQVARMSDRVGGRADAVLYLAANGDPAASAERPAWDLASNSLALVTFLERVAVNHCVFVSSGAVYDGIEGPVTPATPVSPLLPYAISKLAAEQYVRYFAERRGALNSFAVVRFFGAYGPYEPDRKITTRWIRAAMNGDREFVIRGDGRNLIDFMHVDDAVDGFLALAAVRGFRGSVDFGCGVPVTVNDITDAMRRVTGSDIAVVHRGETAEYIRFRTVDDTMRTRFGIAPRIPFGEGFAKLNEFVRARRGVSA